MSSAVLPVGVPRSNVYCAVDPGAAGDSVESGPDVQQAERASARGTKEIRITLERLVISLILTVMPGPSANSASRDSSMMRSTVCRRPALSVCLSPSG